jgi:adenosylcobinamide kinase/adenosylcobinamide-phosphate guanylyltransferase
MPETFFLIGGCRSGKSRHAQQMAEAADADRRIYIATCIPRDAEMQERVRRHRELRGPSWRTVEAPCHLPQAIRQHSSIGSVVLVDCLTLWISNLLLEAGNEAEMRVDHEIERLVREVQEAPGMIILVANEVGTGIVPENALARRFRDLAGQVNQRVAGAVATVIWMVAGLPVRIKPSPETRNRSKHT